MDVYTQVICILTRASHGSLLAFAPNLRFIPVLVGLGGVFVRFVLLRLFPTRATSNDRDWDRN